MGEGDGEDGGGEDEGAVFPPRGGVVLNIDFSDERRATLVRLALQGAEKGEEGQGVDKFSM